MLSELAREIDGAAELARCLPDLTSESYDLAAASCLLALAEAAQKPGEPRNRVPAAVAHQFALLKMGAQHEDYVALNIRVSQISKWSLNLEGLSRLVDLPTLLSSLCSSDDNVVAAAADLAVGIYKSTYKCRVGWTAAEWSATGLDALEPLLQCNMQPDNKLIGAVCVLLDAWRALPVSNKLVELSLATVIRVDDVDAPDFMAVGLMRHIRDSVNGVQLIPHAALLAQCAQHSHDKAATIAAELLLQLCSTSQGKAAVQPHAQQLVKALGFSQPGSKAVKPLWKLLCKLNQDNAAAECVTTLLRNEQRLAADEQLLHRMQQAAVEMAGADQWRRNRQRQRQQQGEDSITVEQQQQEQQRGLKRQRR